MSWLTDKQFFQLAVVFYGVSTVYSILLWRRGFREDNRTNYAVLFLAATLHTIAMVKREMHVSRPRSSWISICQTWLRVPR